MRKELKNEELQELIGNALKRYEASIKELRAMILPVDYYMDVKALSRYSGISVRKLKDLIRYPENPLPAYKVSGSIKIKKSEFEIWVNSFRLAPEKDINVVNDIVNDVMKDF